MISFLSRAFYLCNRTGNFNGRYTVTFKINSERAKTRNVGSVKIARRECLLRETRSVEITTFRGRSVHRGSSILRINSYSYRIGKLAIRKGGHMLVWN